jgi:hypothetical protein
MASSYTWCDPSRRYRLGIETLEVLFQILASLVLLGELVEDLLDPRPVLRTELDLTPFVKGDYS